jgi:hypothetical protein
MLGAWHSWQSHPICWSSVEKKDVTLKNIGKVIDFTIFG